MILYVREITNKLELIKYRKFLKKIKFIKNNFFKKCLKNILKILIRLKYYYFYVTGKVVKKHKKDYIECLIPVEKKENDKIINKWIKNIAIILNSKKIDNIIISERLKKIHKINDIFENYNKIKGKELLKVMTVNVIKYICSKKNEKIENQIVYVLVNSCSRDNLHFIENLAFSVKSVNIITKNLKKFLIYADKLYEKNDVLITVSNNKRKALRNAKIVINIDFTRDEISKYNINRTAIFINVLSESINNIKGFSGIFIEDLMIKDNKNINSIELNKYDLFNITNFYESIICNNYNFKDANDRIKKDNIEIKYLIGKSGRIEESEYTKIA